MIDVKESVDVDKMQQEVIELRSDVKIAQNDINNLKLNDVKQDERIKNMGIALSSIQDDTKWIRRTITGAVITAVVGGIVTGFIALI